MGERAQPLAFVLWLKSHMSIYKESCNIYRLWGRGWPKTSHLMRHPLTWGWTARMGLITSLSRGRTHFGLTVVLALDFHYVLNYLFYKCGEKNIVCRVRQRSRLPLHTGDVSVDTWLRPSELPEFPSLAFAEKTAVDRLPVRSNLFPSECRRHWSRQ